MEESSGGKLGPEVKERARVAEWLRQAARRAQGYAVPPPDPRTLEWVADAITGWAAPQLDAQAGRESRKLTRAAYEQLVAEDVAWLEQQPRTLERDHIIQIVKRSPEREYDALEAEHAMHMRVRGEYDSTIADSWRAKVAEVEAERDAAVKAYNAHTDATADLVAEHGEARAQLAAVVAAGRVWAASLPAGREWKAAEVALHDLFRDAEPAARAHDDRVRAEERERIVARFDAACAHGSYPDDQHAALMDAVDWLRALGNA